MQATIHVLGGCGINFDCLGAKTFCRCSYVRFRMHYQLQMHTPCNQVLLKTVKSSKGSLFLTPISTYCYRNAVQYLDDWFQRFKLMQYSVAILYLAIANLPREIRFH